MPCPGTRQERDRMYDMQRTAGLEFIDWCAEEPGEVMYWFTREGGVDLNVMM